MILKFGRHYGRDISRVPDVYLVWLLPRTRETAEAVEQELAERALLEGDEGDRRDRTDDWMETIVNVGVKALTRHHHFALEEGDSTTAEAVNEAADRLRRLIKEAGE